ncbi:MAG: hypothetical protein IPL35_04425 [Sphingobacteriales bacterium]|nr:hypothetical protein [Sphingobacteriales bacterium]
MPQASVCLSDEEQVGFEDQNPITTALQAQVSPNPLKERSLLNFHPWLFSGAIAKIIGTAEEGAIAQVFDAQQQPLAIGHFYPKAALRCVCFISAAMFPA